MRRALTCLLIAVLSFCAAPAPARSETTEDSAQTPSADDNPGAVDAPDATPPKPNLWIEVEGNRRWCVRMREPVWPNTRVVRPRGRRTRRAMAISSLAYTYYVYAEIESDEPEEEVQEEGGQPAAVPASDVPLARPAVREDGGAPEGAVLLAEAPVLRPLKTVRRPKRGQPLEAQRNAVYTAWDNSRTCTIFPNHLQASLPPGRYTLQANFDVMIRRRGWQHSQIARLEGVEIKEGQVTKVSMQVSTDGYVEAKPQGRVVFFLPAEIPGDAKPAAKEGAPADPQEESPADSSADITPGGV